MRKGFVFTFHSIAGLLSGLFLLLISLSGAILVFHQELNRLEYPEIMPEGNRGTVSIDTCYNILQKQYPHAQISHCHLPERSADPFTFTIYDSSYRSGKEPMQIFLHPENGMVLKTRSARNNFVNWVAIMHNSFHLGKPGEWLFGFFALIFLLSTTTGIILYSKNILAVLTFKKKIFRWGNLHQLVGVYALLFNLMIALTGFWMQRYVFKKDFYKPNSYIPVLKVSTALSFSLDSAFRNLKDEFPGFTGYVIYFPQSRRGETAVYGSRNTNSFIHSKKFADAVFLDSAGRVVKTAFVNEIDASSRYDIINAQVHYGQYGGMPVKIIYCLFGLSGAVLSVTGFLLWLKRKNK